MLRSMGGADTVSSRGAVVGATGCCGSGRASVSSSFSSCSKGLSARARSNLETSAGVLNDEFLDTVVEEDRDRRSITVDTELLVSSLSLSQGPAASSSPTRSR